MPLPRTPLTPHQKKRHGILWSGSRNIQLESGRFTTKFAKFLTRKMSGMNYQTPTLRIIMCTIATQNLLRMRTDQPFLDAGFITKTRLIVSTGVSSLTMRWQSRIPRSWDESVKSPGCVVKSIFCDSLRLPHIQADRTPFFLSSSHHLPREGGSSFPAKGAGPERGASRSDGAERSSCEGLCVFSDFSVAPHSGRPQRSIRCSLGATLGCQMVVEMPRKRQSYQIPDMCTCRAAGNNERISVMRWEGNPVCLTTLAGEDGLRRRPYYLRRTLTCHPPLSTQPSHALASPSLFQF